MTHYQSLLLIQKKEYLKDSIPLEYKNQYSKALMWSDDRFYTLILDSCNFVFSQRDTLYIVDGASNNIPVYRGILWNNNRCFLSFKRSVNLNKIVFESDEAFMNTDILEEIECWCLSFIDRPLYRGEVAGGGYYFATKVYFSCGEIKIKHNAYFD